MSVSRVKTTMHMTPNQEVRERWPVLAGATVAMFSGATALPLATSGMFITSLEGAFGWQRAAVSLGPALYMTGVALTTPIVGLLSERFEARKLIALGMLTITACFAIMSQMHGQIWVYFFAYAVMAVVGNLSGAAALTAIITRTFERARGRALGISMAGAGLTTSIGGPLVFMFVQSWGWRAGYLILGAFILMMTPVVYSLLRSEARVVGAASRGALEGVVFRDALCRPLYWWMMLAFFLISLASTGLIVHFVPLLTDKGVSAGTAAALASGIGFSTIGARLLTGFLVDRWDARRVSAVAMSLGAGAFLIFLLGGQDYALFGAIAVGISFGAETDLVGFMVSRYYGMKNYGRLFGIIYGVVLSGAVFSPILYGLAKDMLGSYDLMLALAVLLLVVSAIILTFLPPLKMMRTSKADEPLVDQRNAMSDGGQSILIRSEITGCRR